MAITLDGTDGIAAPNVFGYNIIINGDGSVNQRGYTSATATTGANEYTLDRWRVVTSGESLVFTGDESGRTMTAPSGGVEQVIEGLNIAGGTYAISWTGTATGAVDGTTVSSGDTVTLTANTNATVKFTNGTFTNVKVEKGDVATPFEHRSYGEELTLCQRYYTKNSSGANYQSFVPVNIAENQFYTFFPVSMRAIPTMTTTFSTGSTTAVIIGTSEVKWVASGSSSNFTISSWVADAEL